MAFTLSAARKRPSNIGLHDNELAACPNSPNCVSSSASRTEQRVEPFPSNGEPLAAFQRLIELIKAHPQANLVSHTDRYLHAEFRAFVFIDDFEAHLPINSANIDIRSASRLGHSDLGANRRRVNALRKAFLSQK